MNPSPLRPIAVSHPISLPRSLRLVLGTTEPAGPRHTADFLNSFGAGPRILARIAQRSIGFGSRLTALGGHRGFALPEMSLDLRHRMRRSLRFYGVERRVAHWPVWAAPPAIGIPARHEQFLGIPVLPEASMFAEEPESFPAFPAPEFTAGIVEPEAPPLILQRPRPERGTAATVRRSDLPAVPPFVGTTAPWTVFAAAEDAPGAVVPQAPPLVLYRPRPERSPAAAPGLPAMRRMTDAQDRSAALMSIGDLAARVAAQHAVPEMFSPADVSRSLAGSSGVGEGSLRQAHGGLFASAQNGPGVQDDLGVQDGGGTQGDRRGREEPWAQFETRARLPQSLSVVLSEAKDLSPRDQRRRSESVRPNFTLDLLRHVAWQPERQAIGAVFAARSAADAQARREAEGIVSPETVFAGSTGAPHSAASVSPTVRPMRIAPVTTTLTPPLPASTLRAPEADWRRPSPAAVTPGSASSAATPTPLLPPFVAARMALTARITPVSTPAASATANPWGASPGQPTLRTLPRMGSLAGDEGRVALRIDDELGRTHQRTGSFVGGAAAERGIEPGSHRAAAVVGQSSPTAPWFTDLEGVATTGADVPSLPSPTAAIPGDLPMVVHRLSFGRDRAKQALDGTVSPVWGALGRQVVPTLPPSRPVAPAAASLPLPGGVTRDGGRSVVSASPPPSAWALPFFGAISGTQSAPYAQPAAPVVYRSPVADRAEPTEAQQSEAAEAMAESVGHPLPPLVRRSMEHRFGMDLATVRVHSGPAVMRAANLVGARAMARGTDVFMPGGVADSSAADEIPLLAHELTHVAQHLGHRVPTAAPVPMTLARHASDEEHAAERIERQFVRRFPSLPGLGSLPTGGLPKMPSLPNLPNLGSLPGGLPNIPSLSSLPDQALTLARPALNALEKPLQQAGQAAEGMLGKAENAVAAITGGHTPAGAAPNPTQLAEQVYQLLERRLIVERERGGYRR
jgi:hypothetical protein